MSQGISDEIRQFLRENFILGADIQIGDDDSLLELRIVDSTGFLELVSHLESTYSIKIADDEMTPDNLETIANICAFVARKSAS